jgi:hypothetical protein
VLEVERHGVDDALQRRDVHGRDLQDEHPGERRPQLAVAQGVAENTVVVSTRALTALKNWNSTKVVNASVIGERAVVVGSDRQTPAEQPSVPSAMTTPDSSSRRNRSRSRIWAEGSRGGRSIVSGRAGSTPSAIAGGPSMMRFTHRIWIGVNGVGSPSSRAPRIDRIAPMLVASWKRTNETMLS